METPEREAAKRTFTVQIDAAVDSSVLAAPAFRFRFLDATTRVVTPAVASWAVVPDALGGAGDGNDDADAENQQQAQYGEVRRFTHSFADMAITEAFALGLHNDPTLSVFLSDHPGLAGSGASATSAAASTGKDQKTGKQAAAAPLSPNDSTTRPPPTHRAYAGLFQVDASSLLAAGRLSVEHVWAFPGSDQRDERPREGYFVSAKQSRSSETHVASLFELPATAKGLRYLSIRIAVDAPLLVGALLQRLNPITVTIGACRRLPGVSSGDPASPSPHHPLTRHCRPVHARVLFFPDRLQPSACPAITRVIVSPGKRQAETVTWNFAVTFLGAAFDQATLVDALENGSLAVEVRDRDLKQSDALERLTDKWEALFRGSGDGASGSHADVFSVDQAALADWRASLTKARRLFAYGLTSFRLAELLNRTLKAAARDLTASDEPYRTLKLSSDVIPMKRRASTLGSPPTRCPEADSGDSDTTRRQEDEVREEAAVSAAAGLSSLERAVREPGAFVSSGCSLSVRVELQRPLPPSPEASSLAPRLVARPRTVATTEDGASLPSEAAGGWKFARMVLIFPFRGANDSTLKQTAHAMEAVNAAALAPGVSLRSYQLTDSERARADSGDLDVVTGVQVIDSELRMIIVEGLADKGMARLHEMLARLRRPPNADGYKLLANPRVRFTDRLYAAFDVDLKRVKLRSALPALLSTPNIYMRAKVSESCFLALTRLADLRACEQLADAKSLGLFPSASMLLDVESKYGESITLEDIYGPHRAAGPPVSMPAVDKSHASVAEKLEVAVSATQHQPSRSHPGRSSSSPLKAPTDSRNAAFEEARKHRERKDFLREQRVQAEQARSEFSTKRQLEQQQAPATATPVYMYSGQKLRTQDALQDELRERLATARENKKDATYYTYSREFQSLALSLVKPDAVRVKQEQDARRMWTTSRGFVYPAPRHPSEYNKHRDAPSAARCEELRHAFVDNANHPKPMSRSSDSDADELSWQFSTLPSKDMVFGGTNGDGSVNADYFRSVHLCGEGLRREMDEARRREREDWERKLVVDKAQLKFLAHGNSCSEPGKPSQLDRIADILDGPARSKPLRIVKNAALPSGKRVPLETAPVTILNQDEYAGCVAATFVSTLRPKDAAGFVSRDERSGQPRDFLFPSTTDALTPPVKKFTTRKAILPVLASEKKGLLWTNQ